MISLTANDALQDLLGHVKEVAQVRDANGKVLGYFTPLVSQEEAKLYEQAAKLFDLAEAERVAATERQGYTIEQVMRFLRTDKLDEIKRHA